MFKDSDLSVIELSAPEVGVNGYTGFEPGKKELLKADSALPGWDGEMCMPLGCDIVLERDVEIKVRDGSRLYADIYRPANADGPVPIIMSWSPYGKEYGCLHFLPICTWKCTIKASEFSRREMFEGADPATFCPRGYAIANVDIRGANNSDGTIHIMGEQMSQDGYDVIEALAKMPWCSGKVGMAGNSFLAISQYQIAAQCPPSLAAIAPFEGSGDIYREQFCRGGIPDISNMGIIYKFLLKGHHGAEDMDAMLNRYPLDCDYWREKRSDMTKINIPVFISGSQCSNIHTMGTIRAWLEIPSPVKFLRWVPYHEWFDFYARKNTMDELLAFFDATLKNEKNGFMEHTPKIRWSTLRFGDRDPVEHIVLDQFPPSNTEYRELFFGPNDTLTTASPKQAGTVSYLSTDSNDSVVFNHKFEQPSRIIGIPKAHLFMSCADDDDFNVFVQVRKLDTNGKQLSHLMLGRERLPVPTIDDIKPEDRSGVVIHDGVTGMLRASRRHYDPTRSIHPNYPFHTHDREEKVPRGQVVELEIGIWAMGVDYDAGESIQIRIFGTDNRDVELAKFNPPRPDHEKNHGPKYDEAFEQAAQACPQVTDVFVNLQGSRLRTDDAPNLTKLPRMDSVTKLFIEITDEHGHLLRCISRLLRAVPNVHDLSLWAYEEGYIERSMPRATFCIYAGITQEPVRLRKLEKFTKVGFHVQVSKKKTKRGKERRRPDDVENDAFSDFSEGHYTADYLDELLAPNSFRTVKHLTIDSTNFFKTCPAITKILAENVTTVHMPKVFDNVAHVLRNLGSLVKLRTIDFRRGLEVGEIDSLKPILESVPAGVERLELSMNRKQLLETIKKDPVGPQALTGKRLSHVFAYSHRSFFGTIDETKDAADLERVDRIVENFQKQGLTSKFCA